MGQKLAPAGWRGRGKDRKRVPVWHYGEANKCLCCPSIHTEYITENVKYITCPRCREKMKEIRDAAPEMYEALSEAVERYGKPGGPVECAERAGKLDCEGEGRAGKGKR